METESWLKSMCADRKSDDRGWECEEKLKKKKKKKSRMRQKRSNFLYTLVQQGTRALCRHCIDASCTIPMLLLLIVCTPQQ